jgi:hypothetical protein
MIVLFVLSSCVKNNGTDILSYEIVGKQATVNIDKVQKVITVTFPETTTSAFPVAAKFTLSSGATASISGTLAQSGVTYNNFEAPFTYLIKAENGSTTALWTVTGVNNSVTIPWGLGSFQQDSRFCNKTYSWYYDQKNSGTYASINCGPTSTTMASKWADPTFTKTPLDARNTYGSSGGWWSTTDVHNYFLLYSIPHTFYTLTTTAATNIDFFKVRIDYGNIVMLCLDISYVRDGPRDDKRIDRFYNSSVGSGHFILLKGYRQVGGSLYFEVYDPNSWGSTYSTGALKGIDRYYRAEDLNSAVGIWWNNAIVITPKGKKSEPLQDISSFPVGWGK